MLEKWKKVFRALLTDLSKASDCISHELIIAKLNAYGFPLPALKFINLTNQKQRIKMNKGFSSWKGIIYGEHQGSILGPTLFNIFIADLFLITDDINLANYADDNTIYCINGFVDDVIASSSSPTIKWRGTPINVI